MTILQKVSSRNSARSSCYTLYLPPSPVVRVRILWCLTFASTRTWSCRWKSSSQRLEKSQFFFCSGSSSAVLQHHMTNLNLQTRRRENLAHISLLTQSRVSSELGKERRFLLCNIRTINVIFPVTNYTEQSPSSEAVAPQLVKECAAFYATWRFITTLKTAHS